MYKLAKLIIVCFFMYTSHSVRSIYTKNNFNLQFRLVWLRTIGKLLKCADSKNDSSACLVFCVCFVVVIFVFVFFFLTNKATLCVKKGQNVHRQTIGRVLKGICIFVSLVLLVARELPKWPRRIRSSILSEITNVTKWTTKSD